MLQHTKINHWITMILMVILSGVLTLTFISPASAGGDDKKPDDSHQKSTSTTQGKSDSNPDGGGKDKPGCAQDSAGCQGKTDRDGNNGCGNDSDRADDNNGKCGGKKDKPTSTTQKPKDHPTTTEKPKDHPTTTEKPKDHPTTTEKPHTTTTRKDHPTTTEKPHTTTTQKDHPTTTEKPHGPAVTVIGSGPTTTAKPKTSVPVTMPVLEKKQPIRMGPSVTTRSEAPNATDRQFARTGLNLFEWLVIGIVILGIGIVLTRRMR